MKLSLADNNLNLVIEWSKTFSKLPEVKILCANILDAAECYMVSAADSFGNIDGGIDLVYSDYFGWDLEKKVKNEIDQLTNSKLPVGSRIIIGANYSKILFLIVSPTLRMPEALPASNT